MYHLTNQTTYVDLKEKAQGHFVYIHESFLRHKDYSFLCELPQTVRCLVMPKGIFGIIKAYIPSHITTCRIKLSASYYDIHPHAWAQLAYRAEVSRQQQIAAAHEHTLQIAHIMANLKEHSLYAPPNTPEIKPVEPIETSFTKKLSSFLFRLFPTSPPDQNLESPRHEEFPLFGIKVIT